MKNVIFITVLALALCGCRPDPAYVQADKEIDAYEQAARARVKAARVEAYKKERMSEIDAAEKKALEGLK